MSFVNVCLNKYSRPKLVPLVEPEVDMSNPLNKQSDDSLMKN